MQKVNQEMTALYQKTGEYEINYQEITGWLRIMIGDTVDYTPDAVTEEERATLLNHLSESYSGDSNNTDINQKNFNWIVYNIKDDSIELIADSSTDDLIALNDAVGFNNGVYLLNEYCNILYNNKSKNATARSINFEDISDHLKTDEDGKKIYEKFDNGIPYGGEKTSEGFVPSKWIEDKNENLSDSGALKQYTDSAYAWDLAEIERTFKQTYTSAELDGEFLTVNTRNLKNDNFYQEILEPKSFEDEYWLASRYTILDHRGVIFGIREIRRNALKGLDIEGGEGLCASEYRDRIGGMECVRPIVTIPINSIDLDGDYEANGNMWKLK